MAPYYDSVSSSVNQGERNKIVNTALTSLPEPYISGLKLEGEIELWNPATETGLTLNTIDSNNVIWVVSEIEGWWTLPDPELPDLPRGWGDGSYDAIGRWANRLITLNGSFLPQSADDVPAARNALMSYLAPMVKAATAGYLVVKEDGVTKKASKVRLSGSPSVTSVNARGRHDFTINFKAVDPIKYEFVDGDPDGYRVESVDTSSGSATATINNTGNVAVPIIIEVSGLTSIPSASNPPTITNAETSGSGIPIIAATSSGNTLEIDTYNREVLNVETSTQTVSNARSRVSVLVEWLYLEPGSNDIEFTGFPSGSSVNIYYRSGWIS